MSRIIALVPRSVLDTRRDLAVGGLVSPLGAVLTQKSGISPLISERFDYASTAAMLAATTANGGIYDAVSDTNTSRITLDTTKGLAAIGGTKSMLYTWPDRTGDTSGRCHDYTISRRIVLPSTVPSVWVEWWGEWQAGFDTVAPNEAKIKVTNVGGNWTAGNNVTLKYAGVAHTTKLLTRTNNGDGSETWELARTRAEALTNVVGDSITSPDSGSLSAKFSADLLPVWGCGSAPAHKLFHIEVNGASGRFGMGEGVNYSRQLSFACPSDDPHNLNVNWSAGLDSHNKLWDGQPHNVRMAASVRHGGADGFFTVWVDGTKVYDVVYVGAATNIWSLKLAANMNQGPNKVQTMNWYGIDVYTQDPGF